MGRYRKKPVEVDAVRYLNWPVVYDWIQSFDGPSWTNITVRDNGALLLPTPEGAMFAYPGDYIIRDIKGDFYPCKTDVFEATYESVTSAQEEC